ncbi:Eco57I restriction-modification methylase domain-containing protein [Brevundimonas halotolerans]|uniref:site-specific DNA-methyltransferase (adenine-specific) n=1 Tax=Brevundimonas halotolerans TaxID=69670 RepID=A0A7W9E7K3_9CAUL|nr:DNA methyltransferase [Brevundimonas halotolerans]MBB5661088.1 hypothetical protein [Brevundimonas halotolerans]
MGIDRERAAAQLKAFDFAGLFNELGWDHPRSRQAETILVDGESYSLSPVAEKRGVRIFRCDTVPDRAARQRIDREITKLAYEHLIIFTDPGRARQVWQWVSREKGKPAAFREHVWLVASAPEGLIQKLDHIAFGLDEEEGLTLAGTTVRLRDAFDRERITKRFYAEFEAQHQCFLDFITGLERVTDRQWYASLMLNRLMFIYFIQKKGFLDGDANYLRERLARVRAQHGDGRFHSFYRLFLRTLFHGGLARPLDERDEATIGLLGRVPYLNGGLFEPHALETGDCQIDIADEAFVRIFEFFDNYDWTLDTRPIARNDGREINPDVLGHIFEKYINNKQMGAYYTKEDVTDYITSNTVIPWLFKTAAAHHSAAFEPGGSVWRMAAENPDAYIHPSIRKGVERPLPPSIARGLSDDEAQRDWHRVADPEFGLPTETWREVVARRARYEALKARLVSGSIATIEEFTTLNLNISQFALDAIQYAESSDLVKAFWRGISEIRVLDPACGSGAFLFAALNVLHPLYEGCLARMQQFVEASPPTPSGGPNLLEFREDLARVDVHPSRDYFIYKSIIVANLYGVDIMDEAVEICKLRLFLKLAAQLETVDQIEPLPDIDFNIRAGNSLIGYTSINAISRARQTGLEFTADLAEIRERATELARAFQNFRNDQTALHGNAGPQAKIELKGRLADLSGRLDRFMALEYDQRNASDDAVARWKVSHKPFHWALDFYAIMQRGGFDVVVGNPPYITSSKVRQAYTVRGFETEACPDIYAWIMERAADLTSPDGYAGMIVPLSLAFSSGFEPLRDLLFREFSTNWFSSFARIPAALFSAEVRVRNTIHIGQRNGIRAAYTTVTHRWFEEARPHLIPRLEYARFRPELWNGLVPKLSQQDLLTRLEEAKLRFPPLDVVRSRGATAYPLYFRKSAYNWVSFAVTPAPTYDGDATLAPSSDNGTVYFGSSEARDQAHTLLNGKIGLLWWSIVGDDFHVTQGNFGWLPFPSQAFQALPDIRARHARETLEAAMQDNLVFKLNAGKRIGNFNLAKCRAVSDATDQSWIAALGLEDLRPEIELAYSQIVKTDFRDAPSSHEEDA